MLNIHRCFSFKIISVIFLFFSFAKGQISETKEALHNLTSSLDGLKTNSSISDMDNDAIFFGLLREIKEDLNSEKNKLEEFEIYFLSLCNLLNKSNLSKEEKLEVLATNVQDLNNFIDSSSFIIGLDEELKNKIILLGDLIRLFINGEEVDLDKLDQNLQSISEAIEAIYQFLNSDIYNQKINQKIENNNDLDQQIIDNSGIEDTPVEDIPVEDVPVEDTSVEDKISNEEIVDFEVESISEKLIENEKIEEPETKRVVGMNIQKIKKAGGVISKAFRSIGDYRLGGYPIQFVHQLVRHMDKVYN